MMMKRNAAVLSLAALCVFLPGQSFAKPAPKEGAGALSRFRMQDCSTRQIRDQIAMDNLLNDLSPSAKQLESLLKNAQSLKTARKETLGALRKLTPGAMPVYKAIFEQAKAGSKQIDPVLKKQYLEARDQAFKLDSGYWKLADAAVAEVETGLTPAQLSAIDNYRYHIINEPAGGAVAEDRPQNRQEKIYRLLQDAMIPLYEEKLGISPEKKTP